MNLLGSTPELRAIDSREPGRATDIVGGAANSSPARHDNLLDPVFPAIVMARMEHLPAAKALADRHKYELGFINRAILRKAIESQSLLVALGPHVDSGTDSESELVGMIHYYVRRDDTVTLCNIVVAPAFRRIGVGRRLFEELVSLARTQGKTQVRLKCPADLPANLFYERQGLEIVAVEPGKHRPLNVWVYRIGDQL